MDLQPLFDLVSQHRWPLVAAILIGCLVRAFKADVSATPTIPARWRPVVSVGLGLLSGLGDALTGKPWAPALLGGLISGLAPVAGNEIVAEGLLGQREKAVAAMLRAARATRSPYREIPPPPPLPKAPSTPSGAGPLLMALAICIASCFAGGFISGCSGAPIVVDVASVVTVAATLAQSACSNVEGFVNAYFGVHPDATLQAGIDKALTRAQDAAAALAALGAGTTEVADTDYLVALANFKSAYSDVLDAIKGLPAAQVVTSSTPNTTVAVGAPEGKMVLVAISPSAFAAPAKRVSK